MPTSITLNALRQPILALKQEEQDHPDQRCAEGAGGIDPVIRQPGQPACLHGLSTASVQWVFFGFLLTGRAVVHRLESRPQE